MSIAQIKSYIPLGAPAAFAPASGAASNFSVSLGFEPAWFSQRYEIDFSEKWHQDPLYRYACLVKMNEGLKKTFPQVPHFQTGDDIATLSGAYGAYFFPTVFGFPLRFAKDRWPLLEPVKPHLTKEEIEKLDAAVLLSAPAVEALFRQMETIRSEWGEIKGYLNWQGVLNNAFHIRGEAIFTDFYDQPELTHHLLDIICEVMIKLSQMVQAKQRDSGFAINQFVVANCTVNMVAPRIYREFIYPYDKRIAENFERFGVHTCNWDVTPYLDELSQLPKMGYLDMGMMSDFTRVKKLFPVTRRAVFYSPVLLESASLATIETDLKRIADNMAPCDVIMADVQASTPEERIRDFLDICARIENGRD